MANSQDIISMDANASAEIYNAVNEAASINIINNNMGNIPETGQSVEAVAPEGVQTLSAQQVIQVVTLSYLLEKDYKIAKLKANRSIKEKAVKSKMKSLKKYGQLIPATYVMGDVAVKQGLEIVDFFTDEGIDPVEYNKAIVIIDGQHRLEAHMRLLKVKPLEGEEKYNRDYFLMPTLNPEAAVTNQLCEVNTITTPWDGRDFGHAAITMIDSEEELPALDYVAELTGQGCSLPAASCYATFTDKISKSCLVRAIDGKVADILKDSSNLEYGKKVRDAAQNVFSASFINGRVLPNWIVSRFNNRENSKKEIIDSIVNFFKCLTRPEIEAIEKIKGTRGGDTKETLINRALNKQFDAFLKNN